MKAEDLNQGAGRGERSSRMSPLLGGIRKTPRAMQSSTLRGEWSVTLAACGGGDAAGQLSAGNANENVAP